MDGYRLHFIDSDTILINTFIHRDPIEFYRDISSIDISDAGLQS